MLELSKVNGVVKLIRHVSLLEDNSAIIGETVKELCDSVGDYLSFDEARSLCYLGFFVTHRNLDSNESMHAHNDKLYYEDGACLTATGLDNHPLEWMEEGWRIKYNPLQVDHHALDKMHRDSHGFMCVGQSYEDCIIKEGGK